MLSGGQGRELMQRHKASQHVPWYKETQQLGRPSKK